MTTAKPEGTEIKPLPCPFCGKQPMNNDEVDLIHLVCCVDHECPAYVYWWPINEWNRRPSTPPASVSERAREAPADAMPAPAGTAGYPGVPEGGGAKIGTNAPILSISERARAAIEAHALQVAINAADEINGKYGGFAVSEVEMIGIIKRCVLEHFSGVAHGWQPTEWQAILDALEFTERECGLVSDAHIRVKPKVQAMLAAPGESATQEDK